jgi:5-methylcytosine-specific restriction endonuclease McrBC GTP-binding regulatory subunit McrB
LQGEMNATEAQAASPATGGATIVDYCRDRGFPFAPELIARYIAAVLTKPFVILAGVSGTGKSKLAELVAEYYSALPAAGPVSGGTPAPGSSFVFALAKGKPDPTRFALVAVRPDWIDNQSILGFVNPITEQYESTQALDLILRARQAFDAAPDKNAAPRYFMLLDEMNLARVEHYFSDWLSCTESRRLRSDGSILQHPVPLHRSEKSMEARLFGADGSQVKAPVPASLELPTNLVVTGTVNVDETTYGFSPKVLDRAMVIEFDDVDLDGLRGSSGAMPSNDYRFPDALPPFRLATAQDYAALPENTHARLRVINGILEEARLHFGYRSANEIALFISIYNQILPDDPSDGALLRALDAAILQKILPRLSGNRAKLEAPLAQLCVYLRDLALHGDDVALEEFDLSASSALPHSYGRAVEMLNALRDFGFVSFFK